MKKYQYRVRHAKNKAVRDVGERYLEALRRAIEMADGLDVIFDRHMTDRNGKYIVFCANKEHMDEMQSYAKQWFAKVDRHPRIYTVYTEDPSASKSFRAFKDDNDSKHLRLLYCIDALNEGIHVDDVSGVILLRPTISPIIYKQQIGRALSASKKNEPVIFDIVNNIDSLYSIGSIEEEMRAAITYYNYFGENGLVVNERFKVFDEVRNCRELFEQLEDTLTASWDMMYTQAVKYYKENNNLEVPTKHKTAEGYSLGSWLMAQRRIRAGEQFGNLNEERIAKLDAIGMRRERAVDAAWKRNYEAAAEYRRELGDLNTNVNYVAESGVRLGAWICYLRTMRKNGSNTAYLLPERIAVLDALGMIWDQPDYIWTRNYAAASEFYRKNGHLDVPASCVMNGVRLGNWIRAMRVAYRGDFNRAELTQEQIDQLNEIGMFWTDKMTRQWEQGYAETKAYRNEFGDLSVRCDYVTADDYRLGGWITHQRDAYHANKLPQKRKERLDVLGMIWDKSRANGWQTCYDHVKHYFKENGDIHMPPDYTADGIWLGKWLSEQKQIIARVSP